MGLEPKSEERSVFSLIDRSIANYAKLLPEDSREDFYQDIWEQFLRNQIWLRFQEHTEQEVRNYLYSSVHNRAFNWSRTQKRKVIPEVPTEPQDPIFVERLTDDGEDMVHKRAVVGWLFSEYGLLMERVLQSQSHASLSCLIKESTLKHILEYSGGVVPPVARKRMSREQKGCASTGCKDCAAITVSSSTPCRSASYRRLLLKHPEETCCCAANGAPLIEMT